VAGLRVSRDSLRGVFAHRRVAWIFLSLLERHAEARRVRWGRPTVIAATTRTGTRTRRRRVRSTAGAHPRFLVQCVPLTARAQHEQDRVHRSPIGRASRLRRRLRHAPPHTRSCPQAVTAGVNRLRHSVHRRLVIDASVCGSSLPAALPRRRVDHDRAAWRRRFWRRRGSRSRRGVDHDQGAAEVLRRRRGGRAARVRASCTMPSHDGPIDDYSKSQPLPGHSWRIGALKCPLSPTEFEIP
jgi:hypothetical protein